MTSMDTSGIVTHLEFKIPTRGIMGLKNRIMNVTHGEGVFYHTFLEYGPYAGEIGNRQNGAMISMTTEKAVAYALGTLQERGQLFVEPGTECYAVSYTHLDVYKRQPRGLPYRTYPRD